MEDNEPEDNNKENENNKKSAFHGGFQQLERINWALQKLNEVVLPRPDIQLQDVIIDGIYFVQHQTRLKLLNKLFGELYSRLNPEERKEHLEAKAECEKAFRLAEGKVIEGKTSTKPHQYIPVDTSFINLFDEWELELRDQLDKKGLLMPNKKGGLDSADE